MEEEDDFVEIDRIFFSVLVSVFVIKEKSTHLPPCGGRQR